jgi:phosphatidylglycerophosphatase A
LGDPRDVPLVPRMIVTALGAGLVPVAPGTFGSLAAAVLYLPALWLAAPWPWLLAAAELTVVLILTAAVLPGVLRLPVDKDPSWVVIDEVAGMLLVLCLVPSSPRHLLGAFLLFRFFDVLKPFPIRRLEKLPGAWGVTIDDLMAGLYSAGVIWIFEGVL